MIVDLTNFLPAVTTAAVAGCGGLLAYGTFCPQSQFWGEILCSGQPSDGVAITFDDGPTPGGTDAVLDLLAEANVKATFFVIGKNCERHPALLRRVHEAGHLIGNHTHDHSRVGLFGAQGYWDRQLEKADAIIEQVIGRRPALFRPPMGIKHFHTMYAARKRRQRVIGWNRRARDGVATTQAAIEDRLRDCRGGDIVLMHDGTEPGRPPRDPSATLGGLAELLRQLKQRNLIARRIDELLHLDGYLPPSVSSPAR